jgi:hypothetical protein
MRVLSGSPTPEMEPADEVAPEAPRSNGLGKPCDRAGGSEA